MKDNNDKPSLRCTECHREIDLGHDLISAEKGVTGPRGVVPLGKVNVFCSEECIRIYFNGQPSDDLAEVLRRIP